MLGANPSDEELINVTAWLIRHKLELPFPPTIKAYVYVNEATMVDGLIKVAGDNHDEAWDKGRYAAGVAARSGLFLRGDYVARMHLVGRAGLFAHELAHVSQTQLREGWGARGAADPRRPRRMGQDPRADLLHYRRTLSRAISSCARSWARRRPSSCFPTCRSSPGTPTGCVHQNWARPHALPGVSAMDWLVERYGPATVTEFLGRFALDSPPRENWAKVFPISYRQFAEEFRVRLENLAGSTPSAGEGNLGASQPSCG